MTRLPAVAIVGCGRMGGERARQVAACGGRIAACADADPERRHALAAAHPGATAHPDANGLPWAGLDGVFVCTPPAGHAEAVARAARAGVAVFVEKPLAASLAGATEIVDHAERSGIVAAAGYMNRYRAGVVLAHDLLRERPGLLGITAYWAGGRYRVPWWSQRALSGGPATEQATHIVDLCRYLGGEVVRGHAIAAEDDERLGCVLELESGALATLLYSCEADQKSIGLDVLHRAGSLHFEGWDFALTRNTLAPGAVLPEVDPFAAEVRAFLRAIATGERSGLRCSVADAYRTQLALAMLLAGASRPPRTAVG